jgi:hypothetical protein
MFSRVTEFWMPRLHSFRQPAMVCINNFYWHAGRPYAPQKLIESATDSLFFLLYLPHITPPQQLVHDLRAYQKQLQ